MDKLVTIVLSLALLFALPAKTETLEALDGIVARATNLEDFLRRPALVEEYFRAMQAYYGVVRMRRDSYDEILRQLGGLNKKVPGLAKRLWETTQLGTAFSISSEVRTYGRRIERAAWERAYGETVAALAGADARDVDAKIARFQARLADIPERARADFYKGLRQDPAAVATAAALAHRLLTKEDIADKLRSGDADLVLDTLRALRERTRELSPTDPGPLASLVTERLPHAETLMADPALFPSETRVTNRGKTVAVGSGAAHTAYHFVPFPRRFHGIFKGIPLKECVGGDNAQRISAERWATVALAGTQLYAVEREVGGVRSYDGFVQHVPLESAHGEIVASTDFGAPALRNKFVVEDRVTGLRTSYTVYDLWLDAFARQMPKTWHGLAVGAGDSVNNAGVLDAVRRSASYLMGESLGDARGFSHVDPMAAAIVAQAPRDAYGYGGNMILDGTVAKAGTLTLLEPRGELLARDPAVVRQVMAGDDRDRKLRLVKYFDAGNGVSPTAAAELYASPNYRPLLEAQRARAELAKFAANERVDQRLLTTAGVTLGILGSVAGFAIGEAVDLQWRAVAHLFTSLPLGLTFSSGFFHLQWGLAAERRERRALRAQVAQADAAERAARATCGGALGQMH